jgi:predicted ATPase/DNA-binding SARP family transcriptional activator
VDIAALGWLTVRGADGTDVELGGTLERRLLAALVLRAGRVVPVDSLAEAVFGEEVPPNAGVRVQHHVSRLRRRVGAGTVVTAPGGYRLNLERCALDWLHFEQLITTSIALPVAECVRAADLFGEALALWRGSPFVELEDWPPARTVAAELEELRRVAEEERAAALLASGRSSEAVGVLDALVVEEPFRERRWALLLLALYRCRRQADALRAFQRARAALGELGLEPGPELCSLERRIVAHDPSLTIDERPAGAATGRPERAPDITVRSNNLPFAANRFVGRGEEVELRAAEVATHRLVTLTGPGGVGKTRLAIEIARVVADQFADGVWFFELARITEPTATVAAVASTMSVPAQKGMTIVESIVDWLQGRRLLMLMDNCEHVVAPIADLVRTIVTRSPTITVLATSRQPLDIPGELVRPVASLDPATEGVELFRDCAVAADSSFTANAQDLAAITAICRRLDGLPLAIELAAARIRSLTPSDLLTHLDDCFRLLRASARDERHQTLHAVVAWSYGLISEREQLLFDRLSVFAGSFDLAAAESICGDELIHKDHVIDVISALVDKSMVTAERHPHAVHYRLLEILRQYGRSRLLDRGETAVIRARHFNHYADLARRANEMWFTDRQSDADTVFDRHWDDLRAAHIWAVTNSNLAAAEALVATTAAHAFCRLNHEHGGWAERTVALATDEHHANPVTYGWAAVWAHAANDYERLIEVARHGIDAAPTADHPDTGLCWALLVLGSYGTGRVHQAQHAARHARVTAEVNPDPLVKWWILLALVVPALRADRAAVHGLVSRLTALSDRIGAPSLRARAVYCRGRLKLSADNPPDVEAARACFRSGLELARSVGDVVNLHLNMYGTVLASLTHRTPGAGRAAMEAVAQFYDRRHWSIIWLTLGSLTSWWQTTGNFDAAAVICGHIDAHHPPWSDTGAYTDHQSVRRHAGADRLMARGAAMNADQLVTFALGQLATADE